MLTTIGTRGEPTDHAPVEAGLRIVRVQDVDPLAAENPPQLPGGTKIGTDAHPPSRRLQREMSDPVRLETRDVRPGSADADRLAAAVLDGAKLREQQEPKAAVDRRQVRDRRSGVLRAVGRPPRRAHGFGASAGPKPSRAARSDRSATSKSTSSSQPTSDVQRLRPSDAHGAPAASVRRGEVLARVVGQVHVVVAAGADGLFHHLERPRMRLAELRAELRGQDDHVGPALEPERVDLGPLALQRTVGDGREAHLAPEPLDQRRRVVEQTDARWMPAIAVDHRRAPSPPIGSIPCSRSTTSNTSPRRPARKRAHAASAKPVTPSSRTTQASTASNPLRT